LTVIKHNEVQRHIKRLTQDKGSVPCPAYLLYGEEVLIKAALQTLLNFLIPESSRQYSYEAWEGTHENVLAAVQSLNTYALLESGKVVSLLDSPFFSATQKGTASSDKDRKGRSMPGDAVEILIAALEDKFPDNHYLIMTAAAVDKRRRLYKLTEKAGLVVDCSVPQGDRQADRVAQDVVLRESMQGLLSKHDKVLEPSAFEALCDMTGFDIRTFQNNLNKLIDYVGDRKKITIEDISIALERTKQDPIYAFTNALWEKDVGNALFYMDSLLSNGYHELQLLVAAVNQVRRLLVIRHFATASAGGVWQTGMSYNIFRDQVMPLIQIHDTALKEQLADWDRSLSGDEEVAGEPKKRLTGTDLLIAPNPNNAYPVYKLMQKAVTFHAAELLDALKVLGQADGRLKSSGQPPRSILADAILKICSGLWLQSSSKR
jgi:DNA polymerase-3 subunit delta